ncbi:tyrosine-type recombinase/integrase [Nocardioides marinquilinus]|uniref:tyrosine-type recombinase/integrase n=1 Tax=Nocardioides marinquilinus TaxID=1210400 RepID=UPI0031EC6145
MRERRSNGGKTVRYAVLFRVGSKQQSKTFDAAPGRHPDKHAQAFKALVEQFGGTKALALLEADAASSITLDELAEQFLAWKAGDVTPRTLTDYRRDYERWIKPRLGTRPCASIDEIDVQRFVDDIARELEPKSVADRHMLLHSMFKFGVAKTRRLVDYNPCTETSLPKRKKRTAKGATLAEYLALQEAARRVEPDAADLMLFIAATGWRWSEAAALAVRDVADDEVMRASVTRVFRRDGSYALVIAEGEAKSQAGLRSNKVPPTAAAVVRRRIVGKGPDDLVFTNSVGRQWYQQNFLSRTWRRIEAETGLDRHLTPHALRHLHVALLDRAGATPAQMQRRVGHSDIGTTLNVYGGMIEDIPDAVLDSLDALLDPAAAGAVVSGAVVVQQPAASLPPSAPRLDQLDGHAELEG